MHQAKKQCRHPPQPPPPPEPVVSWASKDHLEPALPITGWELRPQKWMGQDPHPRDPELMKPKL